MVMIQYESVVQRECVAPQAKGEVFGTPLANRISCYSELLC